MVTNDPLEWLQRMPGGNFRCIKLGIYAIRVMNLINPVLTIIISYMGIGIKYKEYDGKTRAEVRELKAKRKANEKSA